MTDRMFDFGSQKNILADISQEKEKIYDYFEQR